MGAGTTDSFKHNLNAILDEEAGGGLGHDYPTSRTVSGSRHGERAYRSESKSGGIEDGDVSSATSYSGESGDDELGESAWDMDPGETDEDDEGSFDGSTVRVLKP